MNFFKISTYMLCCLLLSCFEHKAQEPIVNIDYRHEMQQFVIELSEATKADDPNFIIIPQNGVQLVSKKCNSHKTPALDYLNAIDAVAQEDLFYGYPKFNQITPKADNTYLREYLDLAKEYGKQVLVTDYCYNPQLMKNSYQLNEENNYISFAASSRGLDRIPVYSVFNENSKDINVLTEAQNFLYLINYAEYSNKQDLIAELSFTNYDLIVMDLFFNNETFTSEEIKQLKKKKNGGDRLVIAYMSIGEAENYRFYWKDKWSSNYPNWLVEENPYWEGNFKVEYWNEDWKKIIYGSENAYLTKITNADFDGVYLDIIDGYQYFEAKE
ncbi:endo alpha-1,4 polygalactosaminidase [Salegentibacter sp. LM13S]|uniref:endo alpha-1,4 polygalactosaminidase n=1 Tax=Salegentibacter lacus TaxID=2873599 RepID=UPI001CCBD162|nr:endo alpha-1,4 polygalactosaminidase [Salegentibacter lacus]MBZ9631859.1 endo alpha-1,4 polygalactosaminidase [Salegentibacter lacus]